MQPLTERKRELIAAVLDRLRRQDAAGDAAGELTAAELATRERFVARTFAGAALDELRDADPEVHAAMGRALWRWARRRQPGELKLRLYTPRRDEHGWHRDRTVIETVTDDMPFLVDSVTGALNRRELTVHAVLHPQLAVRRNADGELIEILPRGGDEAGVIEESVMHVEVEELTAPAVLVELETELRQVLADVRIVVEDWQPMSAAVERAAAGLQTAAVDGDEDGAAEAVEFLRWIRDDHFTFLGCREYSLDEGGGERRLRPVAESGLGLLRKVSLAERVAGDQPLPLSLRRFLDGPRRISISKSASPATVHRNVLMDVVTVKRFAADGRLAGAFRFLGFFTSMAYSIAASSIPLVRRKVARVVSRTGFNPRSHDAKALAQIVESYPRDELFQMTEDELYEAALRILELQLRPRLALLARCDEEERFVSCMVYVPRERHSTTLRVRIQRLLEEAYGGETMTFSTRVADGPLAQVQYLITTRTGHPAAVVTEEVEARLAAAARSWSERLKEPLGAVEGREDALRSWRRYRHAFPAAYQERFSPAEAAADFEIVERVLADGRLGMRLYRRHGAAISRLHLRTFELAVPAPLSSILPRLENMGLRVNTEMPYEVRPAGAPNPVWVRDFELLVDDVEVDPESLRESFQDAFARVWSGEVENDGFNRLVVAARLTWRQVVVLRACCKYLRQTGIAFSQRYMEETLAHNPAIARLLIELFGVRLDPAGDGAGSPAEKKLLRELRRALDQVKSLDEDRILRRFLNLIQSTLRTNYFQRTADGGLKPHLSLKLDAPRLAELPPPKPTFEIFVYSPWVEAVHLRGGKVARGGIRWSDRREDFRTEVLSLLKAQMVKNALIVPVGAKGGFVVKQPPAGGDREAFQAEGRRCYQTMIQGLLDLTDNLDGDRLVPPPDTVRLDGDDPYLVVAADKGTAAFSDLANQVAAAYGYWLGDAFASGGSVGYDHKKLGITARGAWESVKRHFRELGRDVQSTPFTAVGVGDMSGDVFGNGMLQSRCTRLVAAFDHRHVFLDPDPDPAASYEERRRLFARLSSSWDDYDVTVLSPGGGVYDRTLKEVTVSPQVQALLDLPDATLAPDDLVRAVLRAPADLLWLGGIGTFVKATGEPDAKVGDRANDAVRLEAPQLRCRVIGEGANLGITQAGRVELAQAGVRLNTDFIDNSGGVDCSDHEVNIKIALDDAVASGELAREERDPLLREMADEVAELVVRDNYLQTQAISVAALLGADLIEEQARLMHTLEQAELLDRRLAGLPDEAALAERREKKASLTRPEIALLLALSKIYVYNELLSSNLPDDVLLGEDLVRYFPAPMQWRLRPALESHRLRREIIATHVTNSMINRVGPTFVTRLAADTGARVADVARAYAAVREIFALRSLWEEIEDLDNRLDAELQLRLYAAANRLIERATRWFLRYAGRPLDVTACVARFESDIIVVAAQIEDLLPPAARTRLRQESQQLRQRGVPAALASRIASLEVQPAACDVTRCARVSGVPVERVGKVYFALGERFGFDRLRRAAAQLIGGSPWQQVAIASTVDDLVSHQAELARQVVSHPGAAKTAIEAWSQAHAAAVERVRSLLQEIEGAPRVDLSMLAVAELALRRLVADTGGGHGVRTQPE